MCVCLCACLSGHFVCVARRVGVFRPKVGEGRRVDGRMRESRGRSVRVRGEEERGGSSTHSLTLSVTVWRFHT